MNHLDPRSAAYRLIQRSGLSPKRFKDSCSGYILERQLKRRFAEHEQEIRHIPTNARRAKRHDLHDIHMKLQGSSKYDLKMVSEAFNLHGLDKAYKRLFKLGLNA